MGQARQLSLSRAEAYLPAAHFMQPVPSTSEPAPHEGLEVGLVEGWDDG